MYFSSFFYSVLFTPRAAFGRLRWKSVVALLALCVALCAHAEHLRAEDSSQRGGVDSLNSAARGVLYNDNARALELARLAIGQAEKIGYSAGKADALRTEGVALANLNRFAEAQRSQEEALDLYASLADTSGIAAALNALGVMWLKRSQYELSLAALLKSLSLRERLNDTTGIATTLNNIGLLYKFQQNYPLAESYYRRSLSLKESVGDAQGISNACNTLGELCLILGREEEALELHKRALVLRRGLNNWYGVATSLNALGMAYKKIGKYPAARTHFDSALAIRRRIGDDNGCINTLGNLSSVHLELRQTQQAVAYAREGLALAGSAGIIYQQIILSRILADALAQSGKHAEAFAIQRRAWELKDSLAGRESAERLAQMQTQYELHKKDKEISLLQSKEQLQSADRKYLLLTLGLLALTAALTVNRYFAKRAAHRRLQKAHSEIECQRDIITAHNRQLQEQNERLNELNMEKNEIMGIVAHDLQNPIATVRGLSDLLYNGMSGGEQAREIAGSILRTADRMLDMVKNLLHVNRAESGKMEMTIMPLNARAVVYPAAADYEERAAAKGIVLHFNSADCVPVLADEFALFHVAENLISNAVKFSPPNTNVRVRLFLANEQTFRLEVQDEGQGVSEADKTKLFGKFMRLSARPTGGEHSTGLGLSIVKKMVEAMNGKVWCESELGKGARFIVELPAARLPNSGAEGV
jgi:signal transduction histidine kinase